ncbi:hypothetical protein MTO96_040890 [Rhipicephalus appendiculatus]
MATRNPDPLVVWQWNCRGFRGKRGPLQQYIAMTSMAPDVILLQEPNCTPSLSGFEAYGSDSGLVGALVSNRLTCRSSFSCSALLSTAAALGGLDFMNNRPTVCENYNCGPKGDGCPENKGCVCGSQWTADGRKCRNK